MKNTELRNSRFNMFSQAGFGLIELLISLVVELFLIIGLLTIFSGTRQTYTLQTGLAQLQDSERVVMTLLNDVIQSAGYYPSPQTNDIYHLLPTSSQFLAGQALTGTASSTAPGDTITVRFSTTSGDGVINCTGNSNTSSGTMVYTNTFNVDSQNNLACSLNGAASVPLVSGVQNLQILYGVDPNSTGSVDRYLSASAMTASNWNSVRSVQVTVTLINPLANQSGQPATISFSRIINVMNQS